MDRRGRRRLGDRFWVVVGKELIVCILEGKENLLYLMLMSVRAVRDFIFILDQENHVILGINEVYKL